MNFLRKYGWLAAIFAVLLVAVFFVGPGREMAAGTDITSEEIMTGRTRRIRRAFSFKGMYLP